MITTEFKKKKKKHKVRIHHLTVCALEPATGNRKRGLWTGCSLQEHAAPPTQGPAQPRHPRTDRRASSAHCTPGPTLHGDCAPVNWPASPPLLTRPFWLCRNVYTARPTSGPGRPRSSSRHQSTLSSPVTLVHTATPTLTPTPVLPVVFWHLTGRTITWRSPCCLRLDGLPPTEPCHT